MGEATLRSLKCIHNAMQINFGLNHGNFLQYDRYNIFKIFIEGKIVIDGNSHNKITKLRLVFCFSDVCLFPIQKKSFNYSQL